jgi:hypothetical protein
MTGMDAVIELRREGVQPACVMVDIVRDLDRGQTLMRRYGIVTVQIPATDSLADLDFRPLVGLYVQAFDLMNDPERHTAVAKAIVDVNPRLFVMHTQSDTYVAHVREAGDPPVTRSYAA